MIRRCLFIYFITNVPRPLAKPFNKHSNFELITSTLNSNPCKNDRRRCELNPATTRRWNPQTDENDAYAVKSDAAWLDSQKRGRDRCILHYVHPRSRCYLFGTHTYDSWGINILKIYLPRFCTALHFVTNSSLQSTICMKINL